MNFFFLSHLSALIAFSILAALLLTSWRGRFQGALLVAAAFAGGIWSLGLLIQGAQPEVLPGHVLRFLELFRDCAWLLFLFKLLPDEYSKRTTFFFRTSILIPVVAAGIIFILVFFTEQRLVEWGILEWQFIAHILLALSGLIFLEQLYRNLKPENRWAYKFLAMGIGGIFVYDFYLYADALLFRRIDAGVWDARGFVNAMVVPLIGVSAARNPQWSVDIFVSRRVVFHGIALMGASIYLLAMAGGGYYIRIFGGTWGRAAQIAFFFAAVILLLSLFISGQFRAKAKVVLRKNFFNYKYDYRQEWRRFTETLAEFESPLLLRQHAIAAMAEIVDSPAGLLWWRNEEGQYQVSEYWNLPRDPYSPESSHAPLIDFLKTKQWIVNLEELQNRPHLYSHLQIPEWMQTLRWAWLVIPLMQRHELCGFMVLAQPRAKAQINWEDRDLLKTAAYQATHTIAFIEASEALASAKQFEAFNQMSAFIVHDLKNLVAQLSLVVSNAARHKNNPEFMEDAIATVQNSVMRMRKLLDQFKKNRQLDSPQVEVDILNLLTGILREKKGERHIRLDFHCEHLPRVNANPDKLAAAIHHVLQNALDATTLQGEVTVTVSCKEGYVTIVIADTGAGMDLDFINNRLFKPFATTKGIAGMGIGAYQSRVYINEMGGHIKVQSEVGKGSVFYIELPSR